MSSSNSGSHGPQSGDAESEGSPAVSFDKAAEGAIAISDAEAARKPVGSQAIPFDSTVVEAPIEPPLADPARDSNAESVRATSREVHPIEKCVSKFVRAVLDVRHCQDSYLKSAHLAQVAEMKACGEALKLITERAQESKERALPARILSEMLETAQRLNRIISSRAPTILIESSFVYLFSAVDLFIGELLLALFSRKEQLFHALERTVEFRELLAAKDIEKVKVDVLLSEIESLRRQSYIEQFKWLEVFFSLKLREWNGWTNFVEASQRRNLMVHCGGIVSAQYLSVCDAIGYAFLERPKIGDRLQLKKAYLREASCHTMDLGVFLAHTLWRKVLPEELEQADDSLNNLIFDMLQAEEWADVERLAHFRIGQRNTSTDLSKKIATINLCIALKASGNQRYKELIKTLDWSSSLPEFKLAVAVLLDDSVAAVGWMKKVGKEGELLNEVAYYSWPLFRDFRLTQDFLKAFEEIYERPFAELAGQAIDAEMKAPLPERSPVDLAEAGGGE